MSSVVLPDTATHVGHRAFLFLQKAGKRLFIWKLNFSWLWNLPVNLSYINNRCFFKCYKLNSIKLPKKLDKIGGWTLRYCSSLDSIVSPPNLTEISDFLFIFLFKFEIGCFWRRKLFKNLWIYFLWLFFIATYWVTEKCHWIWFLLF